MHARAVIEARPQQRGHQVRTEHVRGEHQLVALGGLRALGRHHAGVVDEHVQRALERGRVGAHGRERADVEHVDDEVGARDLALELALDPLAVLPAAHGHAHGRAEAGEPGGGGAAEAGLRAGDDRDLAVEPGGGSLDQPGRRAR